MKIMLISAVFVLFAGGNGAFVLADDFGYPSGKNAFVSMDFDTSGEVDISDISAMLDWMFLGGPKPVCRDAMDFNGNGRINVIDVISGLNYLFTNTYTLPANGEGCQVYVACSRTSACN